MQATKTREKRPEILSPQTITAYVCPSGEHNEITHLIHEAHRSWHPSKEKSK